MGDILVICEHDRGEIKRYSRELTAKASELASKMGGGVIGLLFGESAKGAAVDLGGYGMQKAVIVGDAGYEKYNTDSYLQVAAQVVGSVKPAAIFASASVVGRELMACLAVRLDAGLASDCIDCVVEGGDLRFKRPVYAGKAWVDVAVKSPVKCATFRPNVFSVPEAAAQKAVVDILKVPPAPSKVVLKEILQAEEKQVDLPEARIIVSGGRSLGSAENFRIIKELADVLKGSVGASRAAVDAGYISHDHQVGQTGKTVNPTLYIACGISGAIQHLAGMRTSKNIVAINKDPDAPIFTKADFGLIGDLFQIVPLVTKKLKGI